MKSIKYYGPEGGYLNDHQDYLNRQNQIRDAEYLINYLRLKKSDKILDLQCAQGRLTSELAKRGFNITGVDISEYMLRLARQTGKTEKLPMKFYRQDIQELSLAEKYNKVFLFFPDWSGIDLDRLLKSIRNVMKKGGWFFYDHDNLFRLLNYLLKNKERESYFDAEKMLFLDKGVDRKQGDRYFVYTELEKIFTKNDFQIIKTMGGWEWGEEYSWRSPRMRVVAERV